MKTKRGTPEMLEERAPVDKDRFPDTDKRGLTFWNPLHKGRDDLVHGSILPSIHFLARVSAPRHRIHCDRHKKFFTGLLGLLFGLVFCYVPYVILPVILTEPMEIQFFNRKLELLDKAKDYMLIILLLHYLFFII